MVTTRGGEHRWFDGRKGCRPAVVWAESQEKDNYRRYFGLKFWRWRQTSAALLGFGLLSLIWAIFWTLCIGRSGRRPKIGNKGIGFFSPYSLAGVCRALFWGRQALQRLGQCSVSKVGMRASTWWLWSGLYQLRLARKLVGKLPQDLHRSWTAKASSRASPARWMGEESPLSSLFSPSSTLLLLRQPLLPAFEAASALSVPEKLRGLEGLFIKEKEGRGVGGLGFEFIMEELDVI